MGYADYFYAIRDDLISIIKNDIRMSGLQTLLCQKYFDLGKLPWPGIIIVPQKEKREAMTALSRSHYLTFGFYVFTKNRNITQGDDEATDIISDVDDILMENKDLDGKVADISTPILNHSPEMEINDISLHVKYLEAVVMFDTRFGY